MNILVTGGAGYIGSHVCRELIEQGHGVVVFDNLQFGHIEAIHHDAQFIQGDLADASHIIQVFGENKFDAIMHFASNTLPGESMQEPFLYLHDNVINAINLIKPAIAHGVKRFVLSSTANLFDNPEDIPITESERINPGSPYGESKYIIERILHWADQIYGLKYACLRYFNASGAHPSGEIGEDHSPEYHLIPRIFKVVLGQLDKLEIFGVDYPTPDGTCIRDYIHVMDLARAHILVLKALNDSSRIYNLGNGQGFSIKQVLESACKVTGHPIPAVTGPRRPGDPAILVASSEKIRQELDWEPQFPEIETIIKTAWKWHQSHPNGY
jgi:UDP-glucose 4-epimerase